MRRLLLPLVAIGFVAALVGLYVGAGGTDYEPAPIADPCRQGPAPATGDLERLVESLVVRGLARAACRLGVSRERLLLELPTVEGRESLRRDTGASDRELEAALRAGMVAEVRAADRAGRLPKVSELRPQLASLGLSRSERFLLERVPASVLDELVPTGPVLVRVLERIELDSVLAGIGDPDLLERTLADATRDAIVAEIRAQVLERVRELPLVDGLLPAR